MSDAATALQRALYETLAADDALTALIGAGRVYDTPPRGAAFPFLALDASETRPLAGADEASEHRLAVHVWSRHGGKTEVLAALDAVGRAVRSLPDHLGAHRLANVAVERREVTRRGDGRAVQGILRLRAVTEAAD